MCQVNWSCIVKGSYSNRSNCFSHTHCHISSWQYSRDFLLSCYFRNGFDRLDWLNCNWLRNWDHWLVYDCRFSHFSFNFSFGSSFCWSFPWSLDLNWGRSSHWCGLLCCWSLFSWGLLSYWSFDYCRCRGRRSYGDCSCNCLN